MNKPEYPHLEQIQTVEIEGPDSPIVAIMAGFNLDPPLTDELVQEVIEAIRCQRLSSPPETSGLLLTIIGDISLADFVSRFRAQIENDPATKVLMSLMTIADVVRGTADGQCLESASLLVD